MKKRGILITVVMLCAVSIIGEECSSREQESRFEDTPAEPHDVWEYASIMATVEAIDLQERKVALRGPPGNVTAFTVDDRDYQTRRAFSFLMFLFTLAETGEPQRAPVLMIPTG
ncbi:MAG: hypothetical protein ACYS67_17975 [Planctomycetota bacterium]|jgi:hypothetical protein